MFHSARFKLTAWYLVIIMAVSLMFSGIIYLRVEGELERFQHRETIRREILRNSGFHLPLPTDDDANGNDIVSTARIRILTTLGIINLTILLVSGGAGYFLAGRTLRPIKEMMDEQSRFVTDASHELRTPLTSLKTSIEVSLRDKNLTTKKARDILKSNLEDVNSLQILTDDLIKLARFQKTNGNFKLEELSLNKVLADAREKVLPLANLKSIDIDIKGEKTKLIGDRKSLLELFVIFLDNAIKYSPKNSKIYVSYFSKNTHAVISIKDLGVGIDKEQLPEIFNRFYRVEKSRSRNEEQGYGLGLSIAKKIVELHNGNIEVESKIGKGTTFTVILPFGKKNFLKKFS